MIVDLIIRVKTHGSFAQGNHAKCYTHPTNRNKVLLATSCPVREAFAGANAIKSEYFPSQVRKVGTVDGIPIYEMDRYEHEWNSSRLSKLDAKIYRILTGTFSFPELMQSDIPERLKRDILAMRQVIQRKGYKVHLDGARENMMITRTGKLVLNDLFWIDEYEYE